MPPHRGDQGLIFYVTAKNEGEVAVPVKVEMIECCQRNHNDDTDCETMKLVGGHMGKLRPGQKKNLTLVFPNLYLHNRQGDCLVSVQFNSQEMQHSIAFNTMINYDEVPPLLQCYYDLKKVKRCQSIDEDPLQACYPVNCQMKYSGLKSYYHGKMRRCQPVPVCNSDPHKDMPNVAYVPVSNQCRDLEDCVTKEDMRFLSHGTIDTEWKSSTVPHLQNMRCHHGHLDNVTGFCICDEGWTSANFNCDFTPGTGMYDMCNIEIRHWTATMYRHYFENIALIALMAVLVAMMIVCFTFCLHWCWRFCILNYEALRFQKTLFQATPESDYLINCMSEGVSCPEE